MSMNRLVLEIIRLQSVHMLQTYDLWYTDHAQCEDSRPYTNAGLVQARPNDKPTS